MTKKKAAAMKARRILQETGATIPVDPVAIAARYGVLVKYPELEDDVSGMLILKDNRASVIGLNGQQAITRQRFSAAHELGHYFLHKHSGGIFVDGTKVKLRNAVSSTGTSLEEIEANAFAAELLMPAGDFHQQARQMVADEVEGPVAVWRLADRYQVSEEAVKRRFSDLGYSVEE